MQPSTFLTLAATVALSSACTFEVSAYHKQLFPGGETGYNCNLRVMKENVDDPNDVPKSFFGAEIKCAEGCQTFDINDRKWEVCHSFIDDNGPQDGTYITIQETDNNGDKLNIYPGGQDKQYRDETPFDTYNSHLYWRKNVGC